MGRDAAAALRQPQARQGEPAWSKCPGSQQPLRRPPSAGPEACPLARGIPAPEERHRRSDDQGGPNIADSAASRHPDVAAQDGALVAQRVEPRRPVRKRAARRRAARRAAPAAARGRATAAAQEESPAVTARVAGDPEPSSMSCVVLPRSFPFSNDLAKQSMFAVWSAPPWQLSNGSLLSSTRAASFLAPPPARTAARAWPPIAPNKASASSRLTARWCACICTRACCESPASVTLASFSPTHRSRTVATSRLGPTASGPIGKVGVAPGRGSKSQAQVVTVPCSFGASATLRRAGHTKPNATPNPKAGQVALVRVSSP